MRKTPWKLLAPFILFELCFILAPLCSVIWQSFHPVSPDYEILPQWTLANYRKALDPANLPILGRTFLYAGSASFLALILGYPVAYFIALKAGRRKNLFLILLMLPFWTSYLIRTYAWMTILQTDGLLNYLLLSVGIVSEPLQLLNTPGAVILGLTYGFIPFATLPIFVSLEQMDKRLIDAARDLGANDFQIFNFFVDHLQGIEECGTGDNSGTMLIIVHDRDVHLLPQCLFNFKAFRSFDILQIDAPESGLQ